MVILIVNNIINNIINKITMKQVQVNIDRLPDFVKSTDLYKRKLKEQILAKENRSALVKAFSRLTPTKIMIDK